MRGKIVYLEKYSVAPSPSRDYYGLRVLRDEVVVYHWKISHGPHKTPLVRSSNFHEFEQDKSLQDDIQRVFDERFLNHINSIVRGERNTLLTLPKCLIKRLVDYLTVQDIVKLLSISYIANQIFDDDSVWETLCKKYKYKLRYHTMAYEWKELFKEEYMQSIGKPKNPQIRSMAKLLTAKPKKEDVTCATRKPAQQVGPFSSTMLRKPVEPEKKTFSNPSVTKKSVGIPPDRAIPAIQQRNPQKEIPGIKSVQTIGQRNMKSLKKQQLSSKHVSKDEAKVKTISSSKSIDLKLSKETKAADKHFTNVETLTVKPGQSKVNAVKSATSTASKVATTKKANAGSGLLSKNVQAKGKSKSKAKVGQSKSTILSTDKALVSDPFLVRDNNFDLVDLIQTSLKGVRSPRGIFDCDFSSLDKVRSCSGDARRDTLDETRKGMELLKGTKVRRSSALERLSEKSEPLTGKSTDGEKKFELADTRPTSGKMKVSRKSQLLRKAPENKSEKCDRYDTYGKFSTPDMIEVNRDESPDVHKPFDRMDILRSLGSRKFIGKNFQATKNRVESTRMLEDFCRERFREFN